MQTLCPFCQVQLRLVGAKPHGPLKCPNCHRLWPSMQALAASSTTVTSPVEAVKQVVACPECKARHTVPPTAGGRVLSCPQCRHRFQVPSPRAIHRPTRTSEAVPVRCRSCGQEFSVHQSAVNGWTICPGCSVVAIAVAAQPSVTPTRSQSQPVQPPALELDELPTMPPSSRWSASPSVMPKNEPPRFTAVNKLSSVYQWLRKKPNLRFAVLGGVVVVVLMVVGIIIAFLGQQLESPLVSNSPLSGEELYPRLVRAMALIAYGTDHIRSGFIVDTDQRKIITQDVFSGDEKRVTVVFPRYNPAGELITDWEPYMVDILTSRYPGEVLAVDRLRGLGLIRVDSLPVQAAALPLAKHPAKTDSVVYSMDLLPPMKNKLLWRLTKKTVRGRDPHCFGAVDYMILETDNSPTDRLFTSGPLVNDRCQLVGVGPGPKYLDVEEVRHFLRTHSTRR